MRVHVADHVRRHAAVRQRVAHRPGGIAALRVRLGDVMGVGRHAVAEDLGVDAGTPRLCPSQLLEHQHRAALGKDEAVAAGVEGTAGALGIVVFLSVTGFELVRSAIEKLVAGGQPIRVSDISLGILLATLATNVLVAWYENRRGHELASELLIADAAHTRTDVFITIGVLIGVLFSRQGYVWVDSVVAILVALLIVRVAFQILSRTVPVLVDERAIPEPTIRESAQAVEGVKSAYGIRSRGGNAGVRYAEVTIAVDRGANVAAAHAIADAVEERLKHDLELEEVTVHVEPC